MTRSATTKAARKAAREAAVAAQEDLARRTRANVEDLAAFYSAQQRAEAVEDWLAGRVEALRAQAGQRLDAQRRRCGLALRSMRDRGESMREIAQMAGIADKTVRELIKAAEPTASAAAPAWADRPAAVGTARVASDAPA